MNEPRQDSDGNGLSIGIAVARFNRSVTDSLLTGCRRALIDSGVAESDIEVVDVPGAWELPLACRWLIERERFDAVIALGAVIRGETAHFDFICAECARALQTLALEASVPVAFGVLTPENRDQALERADPSGRDKGREAARAAVEMARLGRTLDADRP